MRLGRNRASRCLLAGALLAPVPAAAELFECRDADGSVVYQNWPCGSRQEAREFEPDRGITRANPEPTPAAIAAPYEPPERPLETVLGAPARVPADRRYLVDDSRTEDAAWQKALATAEDVHGHGTLVRVFLEDATPAELIQATAGALALPERAATELAQREVPSGSFMLVRHDAAAVVEGREALRLGSREHGVTMLWLDVPEPGRVAIGGDVVLGRMAASQRADLWVHLPPGYKRGPLVVGPLFAGARGGADYPCDVNGTCRAEGLAPGPYTLHFPKLDPRRATFETSVEPGQRLELDFRPGGPRMIQIVDERRAPLKTKTPALR